MTEWATHFPVKTEAKCGCCHLSPLCTSTWTDTSWSEILEEADRLGVETGITVWQERPSRTISANSKLNTFFVSSSIGQRSSATRCPRETLKIDVLFVTIDRMLSEFDRRFNDNIDVLGLMFWKDLRFQPKLWRSVPGCQTYQHHHYALQQSRNKYWHSERTTCNG